MYAKCSIDDLQTNPGSVINQVKRTKDPVFVDQNGKSEVVIVDADTYLTQFQAFEELKRIFRDYGIVGHPESAGSVPWNHFSSAKVPTDAGAEPNFRPAAHHEYKWDQ